MVIKTGRFDELYLTVSISTLCFVCLGRGKSISSVLDCCIGAGYVQSRFSCRIARDLMVSP